MKSTVVVLVNGEALANGHGSTIDDQRANAQVLANGLAPLLSSQLNLAILHGNKPQVGFVLYRAEIASHVLHTIPLDVCGADTQGATGYMLSQALMNVMSQEHIQRNVLCVVTQALVESSDLECAPLKAIGPWFDRDKADQYRQVRKWKIIEEPGRGYRRGVPSLPVKEIIELKTIAHLVNNGNIVIAGGGGGVPVIRDGQGRLVGIEAVIDTGETACLVAQALRANILLIIVDREDKFILSGVQTDNLTSLSLPALDDLLLQNSITSTTVQSTLNAAAKFLHTGGDQVMVSSLQKFSENLIQKSGLRLGNLEPDIDLFKV